MSDDDFEIEIKGKIDLSNVDTRDNGLTEGVGVGEMILTLKAEGHQVMKIKVHKLSFEGTKQVTNPDRYPESNEK